MLVPSFLFISGCGGSNGNSATESDATSSQSSSLTTIQEVLDNAVSEGVDGIFVYIEQPSKVDESYAAGIQDKADQAPADAKSLFKIASISKLFIAVTAVKLEAQGKLSLSDTLASWLPDLTSRIENSNIITIAQIIQHRSGIADFDSQVGFSWQNAHTDIDTTLLYALDKPADFIPGSQYEYSNTNYLLLGKILDKALGYSHQIFIAENIIVPLGMHNTYLELSEIESSQLAKGYWGNVERSMQDYAIPGGSMISTVKDIAIFIRALNTGDLLTAAEQDQYALVYWFNHQGWLPGYQSIANYESNLDAVIIQFVNTTGDNSENVASSSYEDILNILGR